MTLLGPHPGGDRPPQLCRHCEQLLLQVSVPDGPEPIRLHAATLQSCCAPPLTTVAYPAPMSLVDGVWMTERMARVLRGLEPAAEPAPTPAAVRTPAAVPVSVPVPVAVPLPAAGVTVLPSSHVQKHQGAPAPVRR